MALIVTGIKVCWAFDFIDFSEISMLEWGLVKGAPRTTTSHIQPIWAF
jgi:hypothetical protein